MSRVVGIDLGTTNSVAAFKWANVEVVTADDNSPPDRKLTRSIVAVQSGKFSVGEAAYNQLRANPANVIASVKRLMGRGFGDSSVKEHLARFHYQVTQPTGGTENGLSVWLDNREYQPEDISAEILKKVVANAEAHLKQSGQEGTITEAVITIPAYFNDKQRHATQTAAYKAKLLPRELLPEPTAAAISYGFSAGGLDAQTILVYDFGGGTFDASLITSAGTQFIEQGKAGDLWLGGDDIDGLIIQYVKEQVAQQEALTDVDGLIAKMPHYDRVRFQGELKVAAERAKVALSSLTTTRIIPATPLRDELGMTIPVDVELTRSRFEALIQSLVERSLLICEQALQDLSYTADMVDIFLLVGGSSQIPYVQQRMREKFGSKVVVHPRPMYAVAEGAAIVAAGLAEKVGSVSRDYCIRLENDPNHVVIPRNAVLPVQEIRTFKTVVDGQRLICMEFFNPDWVSGVDELIGKMWLGLDDHYPRGTEISALLELDETSNELRITASLKNKPGVKVSRSFSRGQSDEVVFEKLEALIHALNTEDFTHIGVENGLKLAVPIVKAANQMVHEKTGAISAEARQQADAALRKLVAFTSKELHEASSVLVDCQFLLDVCASFITPVQQKRLQELAEGLKKALECEDPPALRTLIEKSEHEYQSLEEPVPFILACREAARRASFTAPSQGNALAERAMRLVSAMERGDRSEVNRLFDEVIPEVEHWLGKSVATGKVVTGLSI